MDANNYPPGWNRNRVEKIIEYYDHQTEDEEVEEMDRGFDEEDRRNGIKWMPVPIPLVDEVTRLIAKRQSA